MTKKIAEPECAQCFSRISSIFNVLSREEADRLNIQKTCRFYRKGEEIFREGSNPYGLFCVNSGKIKVTQTGVDGREQIIHLASTGDILGFRAILSGDKYSCSGITLEDSILCYIPKEVFMSLVETNNKLAMQIIKFFSEMLKDTERSVTSIAQHSVRERVAQTLLMLKARYGYEADDQTIDIKITREELANIAGTSRETAIRVLVEMQKENIIE
ncbi:MAG: Crp/Fnr family transcriptional regulator, partial [Bacteroidia bacterium]